MLIQSFRIYAFIILAIVFLLPANGFAQRYPFYNLSVENGLIQSQASCMAQDAKGNLWIGTIGGLSRYDGNSFTNYNVRNGMQTNIVRSITIDAHDHLWVGLQNTVAEFDGKNFKYYTLTLPGTASPDTINELRSGNGDTIWCRTSKMLYSITKGQSHFLNIPGDTSINTAVLPDKSGIWLAKASGKVYYYANNTWKAIHNNDSVNRMVVLTMCKGRGGVIWLGSNNGLYKISNGEIISRVEIAQIKQMPPILSLTEDRSGGIWMGIFSGALHFANNSIEYYNKHNGLTDNVISNVLTDKEGNVWLASDGQGVFRFSGAEFTILDESIGLPSAQVSALAAKANGLWVGTYDAGLFTLDNGKVLPVPFPSNMKPIITTMKSENGKLWIGTRNNGLWRYDNSFKELTVSDHNFPSNTVSCIYSDSPGRLLIGFVNGFVIYQHEKFRTVILRNLIVYNFLTIGRDSILLATTAGLKLYTENHIAPYLTNTAIDNSSIQCILLKNKQIWAGTSDNGVVVYDPETNRSFSFNKQNGFHSDFIYNLVLDNDGNVWAGTGFGIHRISGTNGNYAIRFYGKSNGIAGMESNLNAVLKLHDGSIWFGTTNGAVHYRPRAEVVNPQPVSIVMQSVKLFGQDVTDTNFYDSMDAFYTVPYHLHLPHVKNNISFSFQAITLSGAEQLQYRYFVDGLDANWSNWSPINSVTYSAIPPGNYVFHIQCKTANDTKVVRELKYPFEIITPFQKTGLFRLLILAGCILLGVTIQYIINKRKQNRKKLLDRLRSEEQAKIRLRTAEDFHDEVGNKLTRINVLTNVLQSKLGETSNDTKRILTQIKENTAQLYSGTRDILWSLQPANDSLYEILYRIQEFGNELYQDTDVVFNFYGIDENLRNYKLPMDMSRNLIMIFKEALNNSLKYSGAKHVKIEAHLNTHHLLSMVLTDDGKGFDVLTVKRGQGLDNMNVRAERLGGRLYIDSTESKGTVISLRFHVRPK